MERISLDQFQTKEQFYRIPKLFVQSKRYRPMSAEAKYLYAVLRDRLSLSVENNWVDNNGDVYFIYTVDEMCDTLGYSNRKIIKLKKELQTYELLQEERQGLNKPNLLYLGNPIYREDEMIESYKVRKEKKDAERKKLKEAQNPHPERKCQNDISGNDKSSIQEMTDGHSNNTDLSHTDFSDLSSSSRKPEEFSKENSQSAGAEEKSTHKKPGYIQPEQYNLLQVIADRYNDRFIYPHAYTLTHKQKMLLGQFLADGWMTSYDILNYIDRVPETADSPFAYLMASLNNLKDERQLEAKILAHRQAEGFYQGVG